MPTPAYSSALGLVRANAQLDLSRLLATALDPLSGRDVVVYLVDFEHRVLLPLPVPLTGPVPEEEPVASSLAGRAFVSGRAVTAAREGEVRIWVPLMEGTERTGVVAVTVPAADDATLQELELFGVFAGMAVATQASVSDVPHLRRRGRSMSLAATMQWELMPPLGADAREGSVAGVLEPAYDIAGDAFDYAFNGGSVDFAIFDGMGHGIGTSLLTNLAVGAYRHARRQHVSVTTIHQAIEDAIAGQYAGEAFATGIVARLSFDTGVLEWSCAGHPAPLLLRERKVVAELSCEPALPFGIEDTPPVIGYRSLQPGDAVLLYTDGVVEARTPGGEEFGLQRLGDHLEREAASGHRGGELLRRLVRAVLDHRVGELRDDATFLLVDWLGSDVVAAWPVPEQRLSGAARE